MMKLDKILNINNLNKALKSRTNKLEQPVICFLTGSSGCGKTFLSKAIDRNLDKERAVIVHFDQVGVPSEQKMIEDFGSGEAWQEAITYQWVEDILSMGDKQLVIFEGQYHPQFAIDAVSKFGVQRYTLAVVTCDEQVWEARLRGPRNQPDLIDDNMRNWAKLLKDKTLSLGGSVIDTSASDIDVNISEIVNLILPILEGTTTSR